jgi:hypothetical protein
MVLTLSHIDCRRADPRGRRRRRMGTDIFYRLLHSRVLCHAPATLPL